LVLIRTCRRKFLHHIADGKLAGLVRGGKSLKLSMHFATMACAGTSRNDRCACQLPYNMLSVPRSNGSDRTLYQLFPFLDDPGRMPRFQWRPDHIERQAKFYDAYQPIAHLGPVARTQRFVRQFPIVLPAVDELGAIRGEVRINSYRQLYDFIDANKDVALYH